MDSVVNDGSRHAQHKQERLFVVVVRYIYTRTTRAVCRRHTVTATFGGRRSAPTCSVDREGDVQSRQFISATQAARRSGTTVCSYYPAVATFTRRAPSSRHGLQEDTAAYR